MSDWIEEVGHATGRQTAELVTNPRDNDFLLQINKKPKVGDKSFPDHNLGAHVFETRRRPVNEAIAENGSEEPSTRRSSLRELPGFTVTGRVVIPAEEPRFANTDVAPPVEPDPFAKGLGDPSAVELINQELQLAQVEATFPAGAGAAGGAPAGSGLLSKFFAGVGSFFLIPLTTVFMLLYRTPSTADSTLDGLPPEYQAQLQQRLALAQLEGETLGGSLVITRGAEGLLEVTDLETGQPVIGAGGQVLDPVALSGLLLGIYTGLSNGDPVPGLTLPSNIINIDPVPDTQAVAFGMAREHNAEAPIGDSLVVLDLRLPDGLQRAFVRGGMPELMANILRFERGGLLPEGMTAHDIFERSGIDLASQRSAIEGFIAFRSLQRSPLILFDRAAPSFADPIEARTAAQQHNATTESPNAFRIALSVLVNPQGSPLDAFFPAETHDYLGHVNFTGTIGELLQFLQVMQDQGRLAPDQDVAGIWQASGLFEAVRRLGVNPIVVGEGSGALPAPDQLTPEEQQRLGLPGSTPTGADPAEMPQHEGFPDQPVDELDGSSPEAEIPQEGIPGGETTPSGGNDGEDLGLERTSFPDLGEEVRITSIHEIPDAHLGVRLDQITEPLDNRANPPLTDSERLILATVILGGKPDTPDGQRHWEVAATKLGMERNIPDGRRELLAMIGAGSSDEVRRLMLGGAADLLNRYPEITTALLRNAQTFQSLSTHADALQILEFLLEQIDAAGPSGIVIPEPVEVVQIVLPTELYAISALARAAAPLRANEVRQPGFDPSLIGNPDETSLFVNRLYADAAAAMGVMGDVMQGIGDLHGVEVVGRQGDKSRARVFEKIQKYGGDAARLTDLAAGRFIADNLNQAYAVLASLLEADNVRLLSVDDRIINPQPSGYRDITMQVEITLPDGGTHIGEIQIQLGELYDFAGMTEHALYEVIRSVSKIGEGASLAAQVLVQQLRNYSRTEYNELIEAEFDYIRNESSE